MRPYLPTQAGDLLRQDDAQRTDQFRKFVASHFWLDQYRLAAIINAIHGKDVFRQTDSDSDNSHRLPLSCS